MNRLDSIMNHSPLPRRRFLGIFAASAALLGPTSLWAALKQQDTLPDPVVWRGVALGADAQLQLLHPDRKHAEALVQMAVAEVHRLEKVFSLYREDSALVQLNRTGRLDTPPSDLSRLLSESIGFGEATDGMFDPTVQVLWDLYAQSAMQGTPLPPSASHLRATLQRVDYRAIRVEEDRITLERPGMALTLNGIAQGYITDRVTDLLRNNGLEHAIVDMGEIRAIGQRSPGHPWHAGIADPAHPDQALDTVDLRNQALSTSGGYGTPFDPAGHYTHLFDPHTGQATPVWRSVTVRAADATTADALSTALSQMPEEKIRGMISRFPVQAWLLPPDSGTLIRLG